ncbi:MAG: phospholipid carrier-dependent glycosyltransferase [Chloroflexi bacterium]|nr:phospholipid carrier-dependent glycosyltransferase [Chloroflexota bacterium]
MPIPKRIPPWADALWLALLAAYIVAGAAIVPFHGDESTLMFMGRDFHYLFVDGDLSKVIYDRNRTEEGPELTLRLLNGTVSKMAYGWVMASNDRALRDYDTRWDWGADYETNRARNKIPDIGLLSQARLTSAVQLAAAAVVFFYFVQTALNRPTAYLASALFALHPNVLINGRRAVMEGSHLLGLMLALLAGVWLLRERKWRQYLLLGVCMGFAVAAKHPNALASGLIFLACFIAPLCQLISRRVQKWRSAAAHLLGMLASGILAILVFFFLNPGWWRYPVEAAQLAYTYRTYLIRRQMASDDAYGSIAESLRGFFEYVFAAEHQYFAAASWADFEVITAQIERYESSGLAGILFGGTVIFGIVCLALAMFGAVNLARDSAIEAKNRLLLLLWMIGLTLVTLLLTPLPWARYYLPLAPALAILLSYALIVVASAVWKRYSRRANGIDVLD